MIMMTWTVVTMEPSLTVTKNMFVMMAMTITVVKMVLMMSM